jgi:hypothetical protein
MGLRFELRALYLLSRHSTALARPPALFALVSFCAQGGLDHHPSIYTPCLSCVVNEHHHAQLLVEKRSRELFAKAHLKPGSLQSQSPQVARTTGKSYQRPA